MNLSVASYELWFRTCSLSCLSFTNSTLCGLPNSRVFCNEKVHWTEIFSIPIIEKLQMGLHTDTLIILTWWKISPHHLALPRVCCYVSTLPPWPLCSRPNGPPCSLNIFLSLPVQDICAYFVHFALNTIVSDKFLVHFPASCWFQLRFLLTDQCMLRTTYTRNPALAFLHSSCSLTVITGFLLYCAAGSTRAQIL